MTKSNMNPQGDGGNGLLTPSLVQGEARIRDINLASWLGFAQQRDIRKIIARHRGALSALGAVITVEETVGKGQKAELVPISRTDLRLK